jgi:hypothetical protein
MLKIRLGSLLVLASLLIAVCAIAPPVAAENCKEFCGPQHFKAKGAPTEKWYWEKVGGVFFWRGGQWQKWNQYYWKYQMGDIVKTCVMKCLCNVNGKWEQRGLPYDVVVTKDVRKNLVGPKLMQRNVKYPKGVNPNSGP